MSDSQTHPAHQTLLDVLQRRAALQPDDEAFTFLIDGETQQESITYGELFRRARTIGAHLQALGDVGERALILCPAGLDYIAAFYGCICSGWVAVPLYAPDPREQIETIRNAVSSSEPRVAITTCGMMPGIREIFADIPELADVSWIMADDTPPSSEDRWREPEIGPESLAYLVFTSGSTSVPKGVPKKHKNLRLTPLEAIRHDGAIKERILDWTSPSTTTGLTMAFVLPVCAGMPCTHIAPEVVLERPARWINAMARTRATQSTAANFALDLAVDAIPPEDRARLDLSCWESAFTGGEQVRADTIERFETAFAVSGLRRGTVRAGYGMTEAARMVQVPPGQPLTAMSFDRAELEAGRVVPLPDGNDGGSTVPASPFQAPASRRVLVGLGVPNPGVELVIVNPEAHTPSGPHQVGEIWTAGSHVSDGYWNAPDATRDAFEAYLASTSEGSTGTAGCPEGPHGAGPTAGTAGAGPYFRTGDLGFFYGGELFITGRLKDIIIIRGRNIPATDIELAARQSHPALESQAAAAFAIDADGEEQLALVHEMDERGDHAAITDAIRHAIAAEIGVQTDTVGLVHYGALPRTRSGKIQRAACRAAYLDGTLPLLFVRAGKARDNTRRTPYAPPTTEAEHALVAIWERVLGVQSIGIHDAFVDLGGDSLSSVQVLLGIREAGLPVTPDDFHQHGTIAALATAIAASRPAGFALQPADPSLQSPTPTPGQDAGPAVGFVPLTSNQHWLLGLGEQRPAWTVTITLLQANIPVQPQLLEQAVQSLVFHHDALRLRCLLTTAGWIGEYTAHTHSDLVWTCDLEQVQDRGQRVREELRRLRASIDLERGPMIRIGLIHFGDAPDLVVLCRSHLVMDAVSTGIVIRDLDAVYTQLAHGEEPALPLRSSSIGAWAERAADFAASDAMRDEAAYWRHILAEEPTSLPMSSAEGAREPGRNQVLALRLSAEPTAALQRLGQVGLSLSDVVHSAVARALSEEVSTSTVRFATMSHGRSPLFSDIDLSRTVGWLAQWIPLQLEVDGTADHVAHARAIGIQLRKIPHHGMGYGILRVYADADLRSQVPDVDPPIRLNYVGDVDRFSGQLSIFRSTTAWDAIIAEENAHDGGQIPWHPMVDITVSIAEGAVYLEIAYHERAYHAETIERFAGRFIDILSLVISQSAMTTDQRPTTNDQRPTTTL